MTTSESKTNAELEDVAAAFIGRTVFVLSRLEFNLGLYLRNAVGGSNPEGANPLVSRLSLKSKLDALGEIAEQKLAEKPEALIALRQWLKRMARFRSTRNSFVHGRWAFLHSSQEIVNVAPGLPKGKPAQETRYKVDEFRSALEEAELLAAAFYAWSCEWPL